MCNNLLDCYKHIFFSINILNHTFLTVSHFHPAATIPNEPLYPFGYGLGYTRFSLSQVKLDKTEMREGDTIHAGVMLKNIGERKGTETVQFYIRDMAASVVRPVKEMKGFEKVTLEPGEEREIIFVVEEPMLRFHTEQSGFASEAGGFLVFAGTDSRTENRAGFRLVK